jgi:hypothetical protein
LTPRRIFNDSGAGDYEADEDEDVDDDDTLPPLIPAIRRTKHIESRYKQLGNSPYPLQREQK